MRVQGDCEDEGDGRMLSAERGWGGGAGADGGVGRARDSFSRIAARNQPLRLICQNLSEFRAAVAFPNAEC